MEYVNIKYDINTEVWASHLSFPMYYFSTFGRIYSKYKQRYLVPQLSDNGYLRIKLITDDPEFKDKFIFVHKLILETFVGKKPNPKAICRHYPDQNKTNNCINNISWSNHQINFYDQYENGTSTNNKLTLEEVENLKKDIINGYSLDNLVDKYKISKSIISNIRNGNIWKNTKTQLDDFSHRLKKKKLTYNDAALIKLYLSKTKYSQSKIASIFGVDPSAISNINRGTAFPNITPINISLQKAIQMHNNNKTIIK